MKNLIITINYLTIDNNRRLLGLLLLILGVCSFTPLWAQQEAKTLFVNMPDSLSPLLSAVNRADCIDFLESKMKAQVDNRFGGKSEMTDLGKDYIRIQMTPLTTWQMKLLAVNDTTNIICTVSTACAPACDSHFQFYTTNWEELPASNFVTIPSMDAFFVTPDSTAAYGFENALLQADMELVKADLSKVDSVLTFTLATLDYMEKETAEKLKPFLRRPLVYVWKEGKFISSDIR